MPNPELIKRLPRFSDISPDATEWLCQQAHIRSFAQGESIFLEGDPCFHFFMVLSGEVKIFKVLESGREIILGIFRRGDAIGEVSIMDGSPFPANAAAQEAGSLLMLARNDYLQLLERYPEVARSIIRDLTLRMRALRVRVETLSESGVSSRIAQLLLSFGRELGRTEGEGMLVPIRLNRAEIAGMVGARVETVIRIMSGWQKERIVSTHSEGFLIQDPSILEKLSAGEN